jgi:hypothetical protein
LTKKYVDLFKQGWKPPLGGQYASSNSVSIGFQDKPAEHGLTLLQNDDGVTAPVAGGIQLSGPHSRYIYFAVDDSFKDGGMMDLILEVDFSSHAAGALAVEYDGSDSSAPFNGAYTGSATVKVSADGLRKKEKFRLPRARLQNSQNVGADFRLDITADNLVIHSLNLSRVRR